MYERVKDLLGNKYLELEDEMRGRWSVEVPDDQLAYVYNVKKKEFEREKVWGSVLVQLDSKDTIKEADEYMYRIAYRNVDIIKKFFIVNDDWDNYGVVIFSTGFLRLEVVKENPVNIGRRVAIDG